MAVYRSKKQDQSQQLKTAQKKGKIQVDPGQVGSYGALGKMLSQEDLVGLPQILNDDQLDFDEYLTPQAGPQERPENGPDALERGSNRARASNQKVQRAGNDRRSRSLLAAAKNRKPSAR